MKANRKGMLRQLPNKSAQEIYALYLFDRDFLTVTNSAFVDLENRRAQVQRESEKKQSGKKFCVEKKKKSSLPVSFLVKLQV